MNRVIPDKESSGGQPVRQPQRYEIRFEGHLSPYRAQVFEGWEMVQAPEGETVLTGFVADQAALYGILNRIRDLGVPLLSLRRLPKDQTSAVGDAAP